MLNEKKKLSTECEKKLRRRRSCATHAKYDPQAIKITTGDDNDHNQWFLIFKDEHQM